MTFVEYIREAAAAEKDADGNPVPMGKRIIVFPGMELTLGIPCQALVLFDADLTNDALNLAIARLGIVPAPAQESKSTAPTRLDDIKSFAQLYELFDRILRGHYIVIPNLSDGGPDTLLRTGLGNHYKTMPCVGGYVDGPLGNLGTGNRNIIEGRSAEHGFKPVGIFQTSDNRRRDFRDLGKAKTYVKWSKPTAEALRQACLARRSRISQEKPILPLTAITAISVSNSSFIGPVNIDFNAQYNAIIGGRGTGKSTVLEYIRWALCDEPIPTSEEVELPSYQRNRKSLIANTLAALGANVQVDFTVNHVPHSVRRDSNTTELLLRIGDGEYEPCSESDILNLLPIQAYSQKQLSSVGTRIEELQRFVRTPIIKQLNTLDQLRGELAAQMRTVHGEITQQALLSRTVADDERALLSVGEQATALRTQLTGLSQDEQDVLSQFDSYLEEKEISTNWQEQITDISRNIKGLMSAIDEVAEEKIDYQRFVNKDELRLFRGHVETILRQLKEKASEAASIAEILSGPGSEYGRAIASLKQKHEDFKRNYEAAKNKATAHQSIVERLGQLETQQQEIRARLLENRSQLADIGEPRTKFDELQRQWFDLGEARARLLEQRCRALTELSDGQIRASLKRGAVVAPILSKLKSIVVGSRIAGSKIDSLGGVISQSENPFEKYYSMLAELRLLANLAPENGERGRIPDTPVLNSSDLNRTEVQRIAQKITPETWLELSLISLDDEPVFEYKVRTSDYILFSNASAGQQATALLWTLLNQEGPPLIIDQPEDDLDNQVMLKIAEKIWDSKLRRQLIFTSHNANIVVNGDADLVICCDYRISGQQSSGQVKCQGAIDIGEVREEITKVMEGGEEAFRLRKEKYGF